MHMEVGFPIGVERRRMAIPIVTATTIPLPS